jgi:hypothetical protein
MYPLDELLIGCDGQNGTQRGNYRVDLDLRIVVNGDVMRVRAPPELSFVIEGMRFCDLATSPLLNVVKQGVERFSSFS